jgi:hypothetical protein
MYFLTHVFHLDINALLMGIISNLVREGAQ